MSQWISHIEGKWQMSMLFPAFYCNKPNSRAVVVFLHALASWKKSFVHCDLMRDDLALLGCDLKIKISTHTSLVLENRDVSCSLTTWSFFFFFCSQSLSTGQKMSSWNLISLLPAWPRATAQWGIQYYVWTSVCFSCHSTLRGVSGGSWTTWGRSQTHSIGCMTERRQWDLSADRMEAQPSGWDVNVRWCHLQWKKLWSSNCTGTKQAVINQLINIPEHLAAKGADLLPATKRRLKEKLLETRILDSSIFLCVCWM